MIGVKEAVKIASEFLSGIFEEIYDLRLEEVELSDKEDFWYITLSFKLRTDPAALTGARQYKKVKINADTGQVQSVKIRVPAQEN